MFWSLVILATIHFHYPKYYPKSGTCAADSNHALHDLASVQLVGRNYFSLGMLNVLRTKSAIGKEGQGDTLQFDSRPMGWIVWLRFKRLNSPSFSCFSNGVWVPANAK